ncbi:phage tail protein [Acinetobacter thermotolerans]|uniref:phage tail protein n=1 Tax=Acinetobacter thermotolerans TaxID=3151487 RepID=UPI00325AB40F
MGGSSKQVVGHRYYASLVKFIGFRIEKLLGVNFDNRGWFFHNPVKHPPNQLPIDAPSLYGENEGGVKGVIDIHFGTPDQEPNEHYNKHDPDISGFPYQSYLVFRGANDEQGFYHGNTNTMRDVLLWPKRTRVQNDGSEQWYKIRGDGAVVCEIDSSGDGGSVITPSPMGDVSATFTFSSGCYLDSAPITETYTTSFTEVIDDPSPNGDYKRGAVISGPEYDARYSTGCLNTMSNRSLSGVYSGNISMGGAGIAVVAITINTPPNDIGRDVNFISNALTYTLHYKETLVENEGQLTAVMHVKLPYTLSFSFLANSVPHNGYHYYRYGLVDSRVYQMPYSSDPSQVGVDINPIHKIREIFVNPSPWGMNKDESEIEETTFIKAADRIYDEGLGVSWAIKDKDCLDAINELCHHIEGGVRQNRQTGKYEMVLFRDDWFNEEEIHTISESKIKSMQLEVQNADEIINHVNVTYYDRENIKNGAFSISENGLIKTVGSVISEDIEFPYFMRQYNAEKVAAWKLKQLSTPAWRGTFTTGLKDARKFNRYDLIDLPWSRKWSGTIRARIMSINLGTAIDNTVSIDFVEVVDFSTVSAQIGSDGGYGVQILPPQQSIARVFELPYYLAVYINGQKDTDDQLAYDETIGYVAAIAAQPQYNSLNAALWSDDAGMSPDYEKSATVNYCQGLVLDQNIDKDDHSFIVKDLPNVALYKARKFVGANTGDLILINNEIMSFESYDSETRLLTVKRGVLDTGVHEHLQNSYLYVFDSADVAINPQQFIQSDVVNLKVLTTTPSGVEKLSDGLVQKVEIEARAIRPYPPANVKINGEYWPNEIEGDLEITWSHRNRAQQTAATHVDWFDSSVTLENGTTYTLILTELDENQIELRTQNINVGTLDNYTFATSAMDASTRYIEIELKTVRDGYECLQPFEHIFELSQFFSAPYDLTVEFKND